MATFFFFFSLYCHVNFSLLALSLSLSLSLSLLSPSPPLLLSQMVVSNHLIQDISHCCSDIEDQRVFAYMTKDKAVDKSYCHVFMVLSQVKLSQLLYSSLFCHMLDFPLHPQRT